MNVCYLKFNELTPDSQAEMAEIISATSKDREAQGHKIVGISPKEVSTKQLGWLATLNQTHFGGYVGAGQPMDHADKEYAQVGSMLVSPSFIGQGIGFRLLQLVSNEVLEAGQTPFAFCNSTSLSIFERAGYEATGMDEIPPDAQSSFGNPALILRTAAN